MRTGRFDKTSTMETEVLEREILRTLTDYCAIEKFTVTKSGSATKETWTTPRGLGRIKCGINTIRLENRREMMIPGQVIVEGQYMMHLYPLSTPVEAKDRILLKGSRYEVTEVMNPTTGEILKRLLVTRIDT